MTVVATASTKLNGFNSPMLGLTGVPMAIGGTCRFWFILSKLCVIVVKKNEIWKQKRLLFQ